MAVAPRLTKRINTQTEIHFDYTNPDLEFTYPSVWFQQNQQSKPTFLLKNCTIGMPGLTRAILGGIRTGNLTLETAKRFIYEMGLTMTAQPTEAKMSFGRPICVANQEMTPWSLVNARISQEDYAPPENDAGVELTHTNQSLMLYLLSIYRLARAPLETYRANLQAKLTQVALAQGGRLDFSGVFYNYNVWVRDPGYTKMVAAIDMFLHMFKNHEMGFLKMATMGSRHRDCAGLTSFGYGMKILGVDPYTLLEWIFISSAADELERMTKIDEEANEKISYFPYQSDLGLVDKTAYSSVTNPVFFHLMHFSGALLGHRRSMNARFSLESCLSDVALNACLIVWVFGQGASLGPQFSRDGIDYSEVVVAPAPNPEPQEAEGEIEAQEGSIQGSSIGDEDRDREEDFWERQSDVWNKTEGRDPQTWFMILKSSHYKLPPSVTSKIRSMRAKITDTREGSIGEYVKNRFPY